MSGYEGSPPPSWPSLFHFFSRPHSPIFSPGKTPPTDRPTTMDNTLADQTRAEQAERRRSIFDSDSDSEEEAQRDTESVDLLEEGDLPQQPPQESSANLDLLEAERRMVEESNTLKRKQLQTRYEWRLAKRQMLVLHIAEQEACIYNLEQEVKMRKLKLEKLQERATNLQKSMDNVTKDFAKVKKIKKTNFCVICQNDKDNVCYLVHKNAGTSDLQTVIHSTQCTSVDGAVCYDCIDPWKNSTAAQDGLKCPKCKDSVQLLYV